jgi:hypothetical protein
MMFGETLGLAGTVDTGPAEDAAAFTLQAATMKVSKIRER